MVSLEKLITESELSMEQQNAVDLCCDMSVPIACVTGGAGVGKTLVMGRVFDELKKSRKSVALTAPTGRAAKRIEELTGIRAMTVHRLLQFPQPDDTDVDEETDPNLPRKNKDNPLEQRVIIVDESSMVSPDIYRFLMDALPRSSVIRFFGDNNQLPPVEKGDPPFITLLKEQPSVTLTYNYRSGDMLIENASRILRGSIPLRNPRFEIIWTETPITMLINFVTREFTYGSHQVIMPTRRGKAGTIRVNPSIQMRFNSKGSMLRLDRFDANEAPLAVRPRDKFIWIKNDYKLDMFNGEIGHIDWVDAEAGELGVVTGERTVIVPPRIKTYNAYLGHLINYDPRKQIELGYAITTHKAQGSEFDTIIYCICKSHAWLLNRQNFYTAITRARHNVILITDRRGMGLSMRKYDPNV